MCEKQEFCHHIVPIKWENFPLRSTHTHIQSDEHKSWDFSILSHTHNNNNSNSNDDDEGKKTQNGFCRLFGEFVYKRFYKW